MVKNCNYVYIFYFCVFFTGVFASSLALLLAHKSCACAKDFNKLNGILSLSRAQVSVIYIYVFVLSSTIFQQIDYYRKLNIGLAAFRTYSPLQLYTPSAFCQIGFLLLFLSILISFTFKFLLRFVHAIASQQQWQPVKLLRAFLHAFSHSYVLVRIFFPSFCPVAFIAFMLLNECS